MMRKLASLVVLVALAFGLSLVAGKAWVPPSAWFSPDPRFAIIVELRLPRAILGSLVGEVIELIVAASIAALSAGSALAAHLTTLAASH